MNGNDPWVTRNNGVLCPLVSVIFGIATKRNIKHGTVLAINKCFSQLFANGISIKECLLLDRLFIRQYPHASHGEKAADLASPVLR